MIGHACMMVMGDTIDVPDLPEYLQTPGAPPVQPAAAASSEPAPADESGLGALQEQERMLVIKAMQQAGGNQSQAARLLRIGRDALRYKLSKYHL